MAEIRETHVERDPDGRVTDTKVTIERPKRGGGFGFGMLLGILVIAVAIIAFAYSQGSFQSAGREADQATVAATEQIDSAVDSTGEALNDGAATTEQAASDEPSDTVSN